MQTYLLILLMWNGGVTYIPGYTSREACGAAGQQWMQQIKDERGRDWACITAPKK
jgi:hypothetical protein